MTKVVRINVENANYDLGCVQIPSNSSELIAIDAITLTAKQMDNDDRYNHLSHDEFKSELIKKLETLFNFKPVQLYTAKV